MLIGCRHQNEPTQTVVLPLTINLPANEIHRNAIPLRRAPGDPGTKEEFLFPHHLYIIVLKQNNDDTWSAWDVLERTLTNDDWTPAFYDGTLPTVYDSIYRYNEQLELLLASEDKFKGRVYAIASSEPLTFNKTFNITYITNLEDTETLTFSTASDEIQASLHNIYSTPYNLLAEGQYFGSFNSKTQRVPYVNLLLYHVAAKVDITWKTADKDLRLTHMKAKNLFNGNAYCFKPMENSTTTPLASGEELTIIGANADGQWWEGRSYFYTIPYTTTGKTGYFPLQMEMSTNGSSDKYKPTIYLQVNTSNAFVPWLRANFNISEVLTEKTDTKTVDD